MGTRRLVVLCAGLVTAGLVASGGLAGCSADQAGSGTTVGVTGSASAEPSIQPMPLPSPVGTPSASLPPSDLTPASPGPSDLTTSAPAISVPTRPAPTMADQTLTGQVEEGVERGCLILRDSTGVYQLLGGDPTVVYAGADVSVTGHVITGVMSYCMQGRPFQITEAHRS
ncbi:hypothetical protein [Rugosimonospora acidiphila]